MKRPYLPPLPEGAAFGVGAEGCRVPFRKGMETMRRLLSLTMSLGLLATMAGCCHDCHWHCVTGVCDCGHDWHPCCRYGPPAQAPCNGSDVAPVAPVGVQPGPI